MVRGRAALQRSVRLLFESDCQKSPFLGMVVRPETKVAPERGVTMRRDGRTFAASQRCTNGCTKANRRVNAPQSTRVISGATIMACQHNHREGRPGPHFNAESRDVDRVSALRFRASNRSRERWTGKLRPWPRFPGCCSKPLVVTSHNYMRPSHRCIGHFFLDRSASADACRMAYLG